MTDDHPVDSYHYVYILESRADPARHYTGLTNDLQRRLQKHNQGGVPHTSKYAPWRLRVAIAFHDREQAAAFETYLKSHSGRAFAAKHF
jgi:predicted GIY-YIG superfamily endonuclease